MGTGPVAWSSHLRVPWQASLLSYEIPGAQNKVLLKCSSLHLTGCYLGADDSAGTSSIPIQALKLLI